jgi:hypothetical protein
MGQLVEKVGISTGWWLTAGCFFLVLTYPLATNLIPSFRKAVDKAEAGLDSLEMVDMDEENKGDGPSGVSTPRLQPLQRPSTPRLKTQQARPSTPRLPPLPTFFTPRSKPAA